MDINVIISKFINNGFKVFPIYDNVLKRFKISITLNNKPFKTYDKPIKQAEINEAIKKTYIFLYNKL